MAVTHEQIADATTESDVVSTSREGQCRNGSREGASTNNVSAFAKFGEGDVSTGNVEGICARTTKNGDVACTEGELRRKVEEVVTSSSVEVICRWNCDSPASMVMVSLTKPKIDAACGVSLDENGVGANRSRLSIPAESIVLVAGPEEMTEI